MDAELFSYPDVDKIPDNVLERAYWRRKLPPAFRFYLEMVSRELMVAKPEEVYAHSAMFYEELLIQRDVERSLLPHCSFLDRLIGATSTSNFSMETMVAPGRPTDSLSHSGACLRCSRCGRCVTSAYKSETHERDPSPAPCTWQTSGVAPTSRDTDTPVPQPCSQQSQCPHVTNPPSHHATKDGRKQSRYTTICDGDCRVVSLPLRKDSFGKLVHRMCDKGMGEEDNLISSRELSVLLDY